MKQIKWKFKGTEVSFITPEDKLSASVFRQAKRLGIDPTKRKIEIINEFFTTEPNSTGCDTCNGNTANPELTPLQMDAEDNKVGPTPDDMRDMFRLLDSLSGRDTDADAPDLDLLGGTDDGLVDRRIG